MIAENLGVLFISENWNHISSENMDQMQMQCTGTDAFR